MICVRRPCLTLANTHFLTHYLTYFSAPMGILIGAPPKHCYSHWGAPQALLPWTFPLGCPPSSAPLGIPMGVPPRHCLAPAAAATACPATAAAAAGPEP
mmetsp:Transcript_786/g.1793  ORF Transcript_786/g.1793 Transcript_786/m.1793 type:complete len:99 (+) Transcript_786:592-888(+)